MEIQGFHLMATVAKTPPVSFVTITVTGTGRESWVSWHRLAPAWHLPRSLALSLSCLCLFCSASPSGYLTWSVMGKGQHGGDYTERYCCVRCTHTKLICTLCRVCVLCCHLYPDNIQIASHESGKCVFFYVCISVCMSSTVETNWLSWSFKKISSPLDCLQQRSTGRIKSLLDVFPQSS